MHCVSVSSWRYEVFDELYDMLWYRASCEHNGVLYLLHSSAYSRSISDVFIHQSVH